MRNGKALLAGLTVVVALGSARQAQAQLKGHYIPGFTGLQNGSQGPPSISVMLPVYAYTTDTIKGDDGQTLGNGPSITASFLGAGVVWVTNWKLLGGNWGGSVVPVDFMKSRIESASLDVPGSFHFTDIIIQPLQLGWSKPRADYTVGYGFVAPTGEWELGGDENGGLGMWSNYFQAGTTQRLDSKHQWTTSMLATYEIHTHKKDVDLKAGDILTLEGGTGRTWMKMLEGSPLPRITNFGLVYYAQFKVTADTGSGPIADELLAGRKDRVFGVGLEGSIFLPKPKLFVGLRVVPEFGARNRTQGVTFMLSLAYQAKSLMKMPAGH